MTTIKLNNTIERTYKNNGQHAEQVDGANRYAYVTKDFATAYIMDRNEYKEFVSEFGARTHESQKNGGGEKIRLLDESRRMLEWFGARA